MKKKKEKEKNYYKDLDLIRLVACIAVLFYHLGILKGGYLAVCCFFVLSGYFSCVCAFKKEKFSLLSYYLSKLKRIYLPLLIVVFITIGVVSLFPDISWFNLKPETNSVIMGFNNFWQLNANLNYFSKHLNSPFVHFWFIAVMLQFSVVFPFVFIVLRKIGDKVNKIIPCVITLLLSIIGGVFFYKMNYSQEIMTTYYGTFTRMFSLLFGMSLGFIHSYYKPLVFKNKIVNRVLFYLYLCILIFLFIFVDINSVFYPISMILVTLISCRLIDYSIRKSKKVSIFDKVIKYLSSFTYEIYLVQYPVMFLFQYVNINNSLKIVLIIVLVMLLSYVIHFCINYNKRNIILRIIKYLIIVILSTWVIYGFYIFWKTEDHTEEMNELKAQLVENEKKLEKKQEEYKLQVQKEQEDWILKLEDLNNSENDVKNIVKNLNVVGVGDSVMLGAVDNLYKEFPNGYFDAAISRTAWVASGILQNLKSSGLLKDVVVLNLGTNGDCSSTCKSEIMNLLEGKEVFWVNVINDENVHVNNRLLNLANKYENLHIVDWYGVAKSHPEYFVSDGIHLTIQGRKVYTQTIYDSIYKVYLEKFNAKKEEIIREHEEKMNVKISFYGNDILLNAFDYLQSEFSDANYIINKNYSYDMLKQDIEDSINNNTMNKRIIFSFDDKINLSAKEYQSLIDICKDYNVYILTTKENTNNILMDLDEDNLRVIDFYHEIVVHKEYLMADGIHLSDEGNKALIECINKILGIN